MKMLNHPNIVTLHNSFFSETENVRWRVEFSLRGR